MIIRIARPSKIIVMALAAVLASSCTQQGSKGILKYEGRDVAAHKRNTAKLRIIKTIGGQFQTYLPSTGESAYEGAVDSRPWIFLSKNGKETKIAPGTSPSLSRTGLFYVSPEGEVFFKKSAEQPINLGIKGVFTVAASPSGEKLAIEKPIADGVSELYLYEMKNKQLKKVVSSDLNPTSVLWASDDELSFDARGKPYGIFRLKTSDGVHLKPKRVLDENYTMPSFSPDGRYLACLEYRSGDTLQKLVVFDTRTVKKIATHTPPNTGGFDFPITWFSNSQLAVTEVRHSSEGGILETFVFEVVNRTE